jgi:prophage regulatory protein
MSSEKCATLEAIGGEPLPLAGSVSKTQVAPLLVDINDLSRLLQRSVASLHRDELAGRLPAGLKIGRSKRWRYDEVKAWIEAGAPGRQVWEAMRTGSK